MNESLMKLLREKVRDENYLRLMQIPIPHLHQFIAEAVELCEPKSVFVCSDSPADVDFVRREAVARREETPLEVSGHTVHFDGPQDQGRDREATRYLVGRGESLGEALNQIGRDEGLAEIRGLLKGAMRGRTMIVRFLSLGPTGSVFSIPCLQVTDSFYVAHSEDLLYRRAYEQFRKMTEKDPFLQFIHSCGRLTPSGVSAEPEKKRIYIDYAYDTIYSVNTQYAGNTVGLKKLALRLTIRKADREGWLAEHMFLLGARGPRGRKTYFAGAFPSACGKTSTAMLPGENILGDDIAYLRIISGKVRSVNAEAGIFGIIQNVNPKDDPVIYRVLTNPGEVIFSNVLVKDGRPYWLGMDGDLPKDGMNYAGPWHEGKTDERGNPILPAHKNARYTVSLKALENVDPHLENPEGVALGGIIYGGRDARSYVPVQQSFDWNHGIIAYGAALETETTFATVGKEGVPEINLMSIQDFLAIPVGKYIRNNLEFARLLKKRPLIFGVNYFLRDASGQFVTGMRDKAVWIKWMELRVHGDAGAVVGPTGWIPKFKDLHRLFRQVLDKNYSEEDYVRQFTVRAPENLDKLDRVEAFYRKEVPDAPRELYEVLSAQRERLLAVRESFGDYVSPVDLAENPMQENGK